jgi:DNA-binding transcriptional MerR regulator
VHLVNTTAMTIGDLSERTGASPRSLRHYEAKGLLSPRRTGAGYRLYDDDDVEVVRRIRALLGLGLPLRAVAEVLPCVRGHDLRIVAACPELQRVLAAEVDRLAAVEAEARATRQAITDVLATADFSACDPTVEPAAG